MLVSTHPIYIDIPLTMEEEGEIEQIASQPSFEDEVGGAYIDSDNHGTLGILSVR